MWTLTIAQYPVDIKGDRFDFAQDRWHDLLRLAGKAGLSFEYLRVVELQKRGTPHFHLAIKQPVKNGRGITSTAQLTTEFRRLSRKAGFGYIMDLQAARLGGAGVASYMSKYLNKATDFYELRRKDGRAIRRYARSRGWIPNQPGPTWRYARDGGRFSHREQTTRDVPCDCAEGLLLRKGLQARRWVATNQREGLWVAPTGVGDYLLAVQTLTSGPGRTKGVT